MRRVHINSYNSISYTSTDSLQAYLDAIGKIPVLTAEEEFNLAKRFKRGDKQAFEKLVLSNLRFVVSVAKKYQKKSAHLDDLINAGNLGLIRAVEKFDETKGFKVITYAVWWIQQEIYKYLDERQIKIPRHTQNEYRKLEKFIYLFEQQNSRSPNVEELLEGLRKRKVYFVINEIYELISIHSPTSSLDAPLYEGSTKTALDLLNTDNFEDSFYASEREEKIVKKIHEVLNAVPNSRDREIIKKIYGIGHPYQMAMTLEEVANEYNMTRQRVHEIKKRVELRIKTKLVT
jgi:RNA polymerase primary sigma factor